MYQDDPSPKRLNVWLPLLFAFILIGGILIGMRMNTGAPKVILETEDTEQKVGQGKVEEILRYIEAKYVDDVDREALIQEVIDDLLARLDPHSNYITANDLQEVNEQLQGNFNGIGIEFMIIDDTIVVVSPMVGGPSEAVGIMPGDKIVAIEDSTIAGIGMDNREVIHMLRGEKGTDVTIGIKRGDDPELTNFTITRDEIPMNSVDIAYMLDGTTGYIKINRFSATTHEEFMAGLEKLSEEHEMKDLIIDVRHNPGGYLQQATSILSQLFKSRGELLVYTEGRTVNRADYESSGRSVFPVEDIVVLINEGSASASEILAGAIQDHDRGLIVGRRSFGKGLVQEQYKLRDGSALRLTVARYYTPSGRSIQKGYEDADEYHDDLVVRYENGELESEEKIAVADSTEYFTDHGRVVYGGGGISPDIFVPIDTISMNDDFLELRQHIAQFAFQYSETASEALSGYSLPSFVRDFSVAGEVFEEFLAFAKAKGSKGSATNSTLREALQVSLKARLAKHLFGDEGMYTVLHQDDEIIQAALKALRSPNPLTARQR